jgi:hypothetical protein
VRAQAGGTLVPVDEDVLAGNREAAQAVTRGQFGGLAWPGLLRRLDRQLPGYAD